MSNPQGKDSQTISAGLRKVLNSHGYGFQYAVLRRAHELYKEGKSPWRLKVSEFPVMVGGQPAHVDLILRQNSRDFFLVGECKRIDSAFHRWCFARAPYAAMNAQRGRVIIERCSVEPPHDVKHSMSREYWNDPRVFHIGTELRNFQDQNDVQANHNSGRTAINDAVSQALRGTSGLMNHLFGSVLSRSQLVGKEFHFLPVVFTTADLWVTEVDLSTADITTGNLKETDCSKTNWIWFNHNRSAKLRHDLDWNIGRDLSEELELEFTRSVAIVSVAGLDDFLGQPFDHLLTR